MLMKKMKNRRYSGPAAKGLIAVKQWGSLASLIWGEFTSLNVLLSADECCTPFVSNRQSIIYIFNF